MKPTESLYKICRQLLLVGIILLAISACKKMDETYREYLEGGEIIYTSKADSLRAYPGHKRIMLAWRATTDPKVSKAIISWNNGANTKEHTITPLIGKTWEEVLLENMAEGDYTFEVVTYDAEGNKSVTTSTQGTVYGDTYTNTLQQRRIRNTAIYTTDETLEIDWFAAPQDVIATEVAYTNFEGREHTVKIPASERISVLPEVEAFTSFRYRTILLPDTLGIDTFKTEYVTIDPQTQFLRNPGNLTTGFERATYDGTKYGTLADWKANAAINNAGDGLYGSYEFKSNMGKLSMQGGVAARPVFTNGKIYQTTTLPTGKYRFTVGNLSMSNNSTNARHQVVAIGDEIPNRENLATQAFAYNSIANPQDVVLEFELTEKTRISIGFVASFTGGHWFDISAVFLEKID